MIPKMRDQTFVTKLCNKGRIFYRLTSNFCCHKWQQCTETVAFYGNRIIINYPKHLFQCIDFLKAIFFFISAHIENIYVKNSTSVKGKYLQYRPISDRLYTKVLSIESCFFVPKSNSQYADSFSPHSFSGQVFNKVLYIQFWLIKCWL